MDERVKKSKRTTPSKKGRPSHQRQIEIEQTCRDYFARNLTAFTCVQETGIRRDAVYDYYRKFAHECIDDKGYIERQITVKERYGIALDQLQIKLENQIQRLESAIKLDKLNIKLETALSYSIQTLAKVYNDKANVEVTPTLDITLKKVIKERWNIDLDEIAQKQPTP